MSRPHQIPISVVWQADCLTDQVFALRLSRMAAGSVEKKACLSARRKAGVQPPIEGVGVRYSNPQPDYLTFRVLGGRG
ncbi:MAG: hypothetical protein V2A65_01780 [Candidatus Omnitrophota bacterium]